MKTDVIKQIDKSGRLAISPELLKAANLDAGSFVAIDYDEATNRILVAPLQIIPVPGKAAEEVKEVPTAKAAKPDPNAK